MPAASHPAGISSWASQTDRGVATIEDVAYHSIRAPLSDVPSLYGAGDDTYTLLGISKPFAIANMRLGVLLLPRQYHERVMRALEAARGT